MSPSLVPPPDARTPARLSTAPPPGEPMPRHSPTCRGCADVPGSLGIVSWADEGLTVRSRFEVGPEQQGAPGLLHGGLLVAAFDDSLGMAYLLVEPSAVTGRIETDFRRPVPVGTTLWLRSGIDAVAGRKIYASGTAHLGALDGPVAGTARALFVRVGREHFLTHGRPEDLEAAGLTADPC